MRQLIVEYYHCFPFQVKDEWASGNFVLQPSDEDIHTANERRLKVYMLHFYNNWQESKMH